MSPSRKVAAVVGKVALSDIADPIDLPFIVNFITSTLDLKDATPSASKKTKEISWETMATGHRR